MKRVALLALVLFACPAKKPETPSKRPPPKPITVEAKPDAIVYRLSFVDRARHLVDVEMAVPAKGRKAVTLMMPTWTPGSYLVREFARHVEGLEAAKISKNRWVVRVEGDAAKVRYRVYARELTVRTSFVDEDLALLTGTSIFLGDVDHLDAQHEVVIDVPERWPEVVTALPTTDGRWIAKDYDELVDSPFLLGTPKIERFEVQGVPHVLANVGGGDDWDGPRSAKDVQAIVTAQLATWGVVPYDRYVFINVLAEQGGGGLEHARSTVVTASRFTTRDDERYRDWLGLVSHELFHAWNGKRLRPKVHGPFDYENEVYTSDLWFVEGFTSYYDELLVCRAGLQTEAEWLQRLSANIERVETRPGKAYQSLRQASHDAWIKFYRSDENTKNSSVSYYAKGALVGFLVDAHLRATTFGQKRLDDVMRAAYAKYAGEHGFTSDDLMQVFEDVGGAGTRAYVERLVSTTEPLDYEGAFAWYGLRFAEEKPSKDGYLGVVTRRTRGRLVVTEVRRGTPAYEAGLNVDDELIAIGDDRIDDIARDLKGRPPGTKLSILVSRRRRLRRIEVELQERPRERYRVKTKSPRAQSQKDHLDDLLTRP